MAGEHKKAADKIELESISSLIPQSKEGDQQALDQIMAQIKDYVDLMANRYFDKSLQQKVGPSDIVQQTLTQVVENFDKFRGKTSAEFRGWLKTIVVHEVGRVRRHFRTDKRDYGRENVLAGGANPDGHDAFLPKDNNLTPSSEAMAAEKIANFYSVLDQLPEDYAEVIQLRSIEKLPFNEVAKRMGRTHDSVTKLWYRAVLKFEERLRKNGNFESRVSDH